MLHDYANGAVKGGNNNVLFCFVFFFFSIEKSPFSSAGLTFVLSGVLWHFYFPPRTRVFMMQG